jgi:hypothetical protein
MSEEMELERREAAELLVNLVNVYFSPHFESESDSDESYSPSKKLKTNNNSTCLK